MNYRTDLALERRELIKDSVPDGVKLDEEIDGEIKITRIKIETPEGAEKLGKPCGNYITVEIPKPAADPNENEKEIEAISRELSKLVTKDGCVLVVGLGNHNITPDAVGPKTVEGTISTRHLSEQMPQLNFRPVAAITTGVMGQTGIETGEIVKSICKQIEVSCIIAVDALASMSTKRLGCTVQISDSGICPGSGVGNKRAELSEKTLGVPVVAVGVPTVVDALTVAYDAVREGSEQSIDEKKLSNFMVTPREIDSLVTAVSRILALAIGRTLQPAFSISELYFLSV